MFRKTNVIVKCCLDQTSITFSILHLLLITVLSVVIGCKK